MAETYIAVIDIGKTNKKVVIYDQSLKQVDVVRKNFDEIESDGVLLEDLSGIWGWLKESIRNFAVKYRIGAISVTTHGAMAVCLDKQGSVAVPPVAYTTDAGKESDEKFYNLCGNIEGLQEKTATADVGNLINLGKMFRFLQEKYPEDWQNVHMILNYPQYFGFMLTGKYGAEPTYIGCHTFLWDMENKKYSDVADKLDIRKKLPVRIANSWESLGNVTQEMAAELYLPEDCLVTMGIHDSNSSLLPYLVQDDKDFVLDSTGTWCVVMHPSKSTAFEKDELGKCVFYNMSAFFQPVKTAIFLGGLEFSTYVELLGIDVNSPEYKFDPELYSSVVAENNCYILPSVLKGAGIFPDSPARAVENAKEFSLEDMKKSADKIPGFMKDKRKAVAALNLSLALQTRCALDMADFSGKGDLYIEGGFRNNDSYIRLLSALYPEADVACTYLEEATAFGAAMLAKAALLNDSPKVLKEFFSIEKIPVEKTVITGIENYSDNFFELLKK